MYTWNPSRTGWKDPAPLTTKMISKVTHHFFILEFKRNLPKHLKRKQIFYDSHKEVYYNEGVPVAKVKYMGAFKDKACTIKKRIICLLFGHKPDRNFSVKCVPLMMVTHQRCERCGCTIKTVRYFFS